MENRKGGGQVTDSTEGQPPYQDPLVREIWRVFGGDRAAEQSHREDSSILAQEKTRVEGPEEKDGGQIDAVGDTIIKEENPVKAGKGVSGKQRRPKLSKQEWRQIQSAQMQKYAGIEESSIPEMGCIFAHDRFYLIRNYGLGMFEVTVRLDPAKHQKRINIYLEEFEKWK